MRPEFHVDILTLLVVAVGVIGTWYTQKATLKWHTSWIKKHDAECDEQRRMNNTILIELRTSNAHLVTLTEGHSQRIDRIEDYVDRKTR